MRYPTIILFAALICSLSSETIKFAIGDWEPFTSSRTENANIAEIIVEEAYELEGIDISFEYFPWKRSYEMAKKNDYSGTFPWIHTDERDKIFIYNKEPIIKEKTVFFHLKSVDFQWEEVSDLSIYKVGGTIGYAQAEILENSGLNLDLVSKEDMNFKKLVTGRIDIYPCSFLVGYYLINMNFAPAQAALFTNHPKPLMEDYYYMLFSRNNPNAQVMADKLDSGLRKLKKSGRYDEIISEVLTKKK